MKRLLIAGLSLSLFLTSCNEAIDYNNTVVAMHEQYTKRFESEVNVISSTDDITKKQAAVASIEKLTDSCNDALSKMKPTEEAGVFHTKLVALYGAVKSDMVPVVKKMAAIKNDDANVDAYNKLVDEFNAATQKVDKMENDVIAAQREFAAKSNTQLR